MKYPYIAWFRSFGLAQGRLVIVIGAYNSSMSSIIYINDWNNMTYICNSSQLILL